MQPPLPLIQRRRVQAAEGWLELGDPWSALQELAGLEARFQNHFSALELRCRIYCHTKDWKRAASIADILTQNFPQEPASWLHKGITLQALGRTQTAFRVLVRPALTFRDCWQIPYRLADISRELGLAQVAESWLKIALRRGGWHLVREAILDGKIATEEWEAVSALGRSTKAMPKVWYWFRYRL